MEGSSLFNKAVEIATNLSDLKESRSQLRKKLLDSTLCNGVEFTQDLEALYRDVWITWCQNKYDSNPFN